MNTELEALILAYDTMLQAGGEDSKRLRKLYDARLDEVLTRYPNLSREKLQAVVRKAYSRWLTAQQKPSALPPRA